MGSEAYFCPDLYQTPYIKLLKTKRECSDVGEENLGTASSLSRCAESCEKKSGCTVFIWRKSDGACYYEKTHKPHECSNEIASTYDMYDLTGDVQSLPTGCKTSCAISGQQCPLEQPRVLGWSRIPAGTVRTRREI